MYGNNECINKNVRCLHIFDNHEYMNKNVRRHHVFGNHGKCVLKSSTPTSFSAPSLWTSSQKLVETFTVIGVKSAKYFFMK